MAGAPEAAFAGNVNNLAKDVLGLGLWGAYPSGPGGGEVAVIGEKGFTGLVGLMGRAELGYRSADQAPYLRIGADLTYFLVGPYIGLTQVFNAYPATALAIGLTATVPGNVTSWPISITIRASHEAFLYNRAHNADGWVLGGSVSWDFR